MPRGRYVEDWGALRFPRFDGRDLFSIVTGRVKRRRPPPPYLYTYREYNDRPRLQIHPQRAPSSPRYGDTPARWARQPIVMFLSPYQGRNGWRNAMGRGGFRYGKRRIPHLDPSTEHARAMRGAETWSTTGPGDRWNILRPIAESYGTSVGTRSVRR